MKIDGHRLMAVGLLFDRNCHIMCVVFGLDLEQRLDRVWNLQAHVPSDDSINFKIII